MFFFYVIHNLFALLEFEKYAEFHFLNDTFRVHFIDIYKTKTLAKLLHLWKRDGALHNVERFFAFITSLLWSDFS